jgi:Outer membrane protein beta-barrel domain
MKRTLLLLVGILSLVSAARGQERETPAAEISAGYSYFRAGGQDGLNLHGGSVSLAANVNHWFGVVGDYGLYHTQPSGFGGINFHSFTVGPRFSFRSSSKITPFAQVLVGGFHGLSTTGFALSVGGGLDVKVSEHLAIRPFQVEYMLLRAQGDNLNCGRVSAGIVFRFGGR